MSKAAPKTSWPSNAWYVACTPDEMAERPLGRTICGERVVLYRGEGGRAVALEDFCPHRGAPLSLGFLKDGRLTCGYHGLTLACDGRPSAMPGQDVARFPSARAFPVVERYGFIWIWPGEASLADPARLPRLAWAESEQWTYGGGLYRVACDYRLMIDNLMDLTHEAYVHAASIGQKEIDEAPVETRLEGEEVVTSRLMHRVAAPPFWRAGLRHAGLPEDSRVDRWQICRFSLPSHVMIDVGVALAGRGGPQAEASAKASSIVVDFITPETETSHWYFWGMARSFAVQDATVTAAIREGQAKIFAEDLQVLEMQQQNLSRHPERRLLSLNIDAGGVHARRLIERAIAAEGG
jgi:vanillate O-demethylase monooxygenase subunit